MTSTSPSRWQTEVSGWLRRRPWPCSPSLLAKAFPVISVWEGSDFSPQTWLLACARSFLGGAGKAELHSLVSSGCWSLFLSCSSVPYVIFPASFLKQIHHNPTAALMVFTHSMDLHAGGRSPARLRGCWAAQAASVGIRPC